MRRAVVALTTLAAVGCVRGHVLVPADERGRLERELSRGQPEFLRVSVYVTPLYRDGTKKLLTPLLPQELPRVDNTDGKLAAEKVIPAGARVRIDRIEFPTSWVIAQRALGTPRTQPWVYVAVDGEQREVPYVIVLSERLQSRSDVLAALDAVLLGEDPKARLRGYTDPVREAIAQKHALVDMPADALETSWGAPEKKEISFDGSSRVETWTYPGGGRKAYLRDNRVERFDGES